MAKNQQPKNQLKPINNPTIGADIELFLKNYVNDEIVSAEGIIKGTKFAPFQFDEHNQYFSTSLDNVMAEFTIPPARESLQFANNIKYAIGWINGFIPKELQTVTLAAARVNPKYLETENAKLFGCEPDYNAWLMGDMNPKPECDSNLRSAGGHIHIGYDKPDYDISMALIRAMDIFIGLPSVIQEPDNERKQLYGKAGAFRHKPYGVEYRTVSNYYVESDSLMEWAFNNTLEAIDFVNNNSPLTGEHAKSIITAINTADKELASTICKYFGVKLAA